MRDCIVKTRGLEPDMISIPRIFLSVVFCMAGSGRALAQACPDVAQQSEFAKLTLSQVKSGSAKLYFAKDDCYPRRQGA